MNGTVIITGGSRGLGKELVDLFLKENWNVSTFSRNWPQEFEFRGPSFLGLKADIRFEADVERIISETKRLLGNPSMLILNAGWVSKATRIIDENIINLREDVEVNLISNTFMVQEFLRKCSPEAVVHITSDVAESPYPSWGFYGASKKAMDYIIETLKLENHDVKLISIDPGDMNTAMHRTADPEADPAGLSDPAEAAKKVFNRINKEVKR
jgi:NAD(P)-dependent dehydrogenase (short-subunit alcohol dehydrogenase family)